MYEDTLGNFWIGTHGEGLNKFDRDTGQVIRYQFDAAHLDSLSHNNLSWIYEDTKGRLWIGTEGGLNLFDQDKEAFIHYKEKDGLPDNRISGILEDSQGNLWIVTAGGLSRFHPETGVFENYDIRDGLPSNMFLKGACYKSRSGEMFFGSAKGLVVFTPELFSNNPSIPSVMITDFQLFNQSVKVGDTSLLHKAITDTDEITLSYKHNVFAFEFAAFDYTMPEKNQYAYMLEGFDKEWVSSGRRLASLVNDLLDFSKLKKQDLTLQRKPVDLRVLTEIVLQLSAPLLAGKDSGAAQRHPGGSAARGRR